MTLPSFQRVAEIQRVVAEHYRVPLRKMTDRDYSRAITHPRHVAMYLAFETGRNKSHIGRMFRRHPSTVLHAVRQVTALCAINDVVASDVEALRARVG